MDQLIHRFTPMLRAHIVREWRYVQLPDPAIGIEDLQGVAVETMWTFTQTYRDFAEEHSLDPDNTRAYWGILKKRTRWAILSYLDEEMHKDDHHDALSSEFDDAANLVYELRVPVRDSLLHRSIIAGYHTLSLRDQLLLSLRYWEELAFEDVGRLMGCHTDNAGRDTRKATKRLLLIATTEVLNVARPRPGASRRWEPTPELVSWLFLRYGVDPARYTAFVGALMQADVSYLTEILDQANGRTRRKYTDIGSEKIRAERSGLTEELVRAIRAELEAGTPQAQIASYHGISQSTVSGIHTGTGYEWVA